MKRHSQKSNLIWGAGLLAMLALAHPGRSQDGADIDEPVAEQSVEETTATAGADEAPPVEAAPTEETSKAPEKAASTAAAAAAPEAAPAEGGTPPPVAGAGDAPAAAPVEFNPDVPDSVGSGERLVIREGEFSMNGPSGWNVFTKHPSLTLLMQAPKDPNLKYQRTIQVAAFTGPKFIDNVTAKEFEDIITQKFKTAMLGIEDFNLRNHSEVEMADGREGILFYSSFKINDVSLMQAHILVSSQDKHYLLTYTDVVEHFESDSSNQYLTEAWDAMISAELNSPTPVRFQTGIMVVAGIIGVIVLLLIGVVIARRRAGNEYKEYADHGGKDESGLSTLPPESVAHKSSKGAKTMPEPSYLTSSFPTGLSKMPESVQPSHLTSKKSKAPHGSTHDEE